MESNEIVSNETPASQHNVVGSSTLPYTQQLRPVIDPTDASNDQLHQLEAAFRTILSVCYQHDLLYYCYIIPSNVLLSRLTVLYMLDSHDFNDYYMYICFVPSLYDNMCFFILGYNR